MNSITQQLDPIFKPESIAVIGASNKVGKWGYLMVSVPLSTGYRGAIYPINTGHKEIQGLRCYPSVLDIPDKVDMAIIVVPTAKVAKAVQECADKGVKGAVIITAGFAETGNQGKLLQDEIVKIARKGGIRFVGPNCMGIWSAAGQLNLCLRKLPEEGTISFVSQSGTYGANLAEVASLKGYGLSKFISIGNQADITESEYLEYLAEDEETKVIIFYIEGFKDGRRFFELAKEIVQKKPIIVFKGGRTEAGARATISHTASLAGSQKVFEAVCRQAGILIAQEAFHSFEMAEALVHQPLPRGNRVAIMGSGGQGVVTSDACAALGLEVPAFDSETTQELQKLLTAHAPPPRNPVDLAGSYSTIAQHISILEKLLSLDFIDGVITNDPINWSVDKSSATADADRDVARFASLPGKYNKPLITLHSPGFADFVTDNTRTKSGVTIYETPEQCARAMYTLSEYAEILRRQER